MTLTHSFKDTVKARLHGDVAFQDELFRQGIECLLSGDVGTGKAVLRDFINATIGFKNLAEVTNTSSKSLMRMFSQRGNPQAKNLFAIISHLQLESGIQLGVSARHRSRSSSLPA